MPLLSSDLSTVDKLSAVSLLGVLPRSVTRTIRRPAVLLQCFEQLRDRNSEILAPPIWSYHISLGNFFTLNSSIA